MTPRSLLLLFFAAAISSSSAAAAAAAAAGGGSGADLAGELLALRGRSPSGVIRLDDALLSRFLLSPSTPRPYTLIIFFDAASLHSKPDLHLPQLRSEFALVSAAAAAHPTLFFCDLDFSQSQHSFSLFGVNSLPHVRLVPPSSSPRDSLPMDQSSFSRLADSMSEFVESKTGLTLAPIVRPPPISPKQAYSVIILLIIISPFVVKRVLRGDTVVHDPKLWGSLAVFVYFFSVSGTMHNIIRKMPMVLTDREDPSKMVFFYQGSGMQLGAEGFIVGFLYTVVGLLMAFVTHVLVRVEGVQRQRGFMLVALVVSYWAVSKVIYLDNWKTGYGIHAFWPSSWN